MTTPYKPVAWTEGPLQVSKLQQMADNDQWLFENGARMLYYAHGISRATGNKMLCGFMLFPAYQLQLQSATQYFPNFFSAGCQPVVTASLYSIGLKKVHLMLTGIGRDLPDHRGFAAYLSTDDNTSSTNYFHSVTRLGWIAMGY